MSERPTTSPVLSDHQLRLLNLIGSAKDSILAARDSKPGKREHYLTMAISNIDSARQEIWSGGGR